MNINWLGNAFETGIIGTVISQSDKNTCRIRLDKVLNDEEHSTGEVIITQESAALDVSRETSQ